MQKQNLKIIFLLAAFLMLPHFADATTLFSESFENSNFSARGWYDNSTQGTIAAGGQSGNCLQWAWAQGATLPTNVGGTTRMKFTPTDKLYVSFYVKFQTGWRGSQMLYHPHMFNILSDLDGDWAPPGDSYLDTYIEFLSDVGSPYAIRPQLSLQDELRTNASYGTPPVDISALTENRSVNYCNGYKAGADSGIDKTCYLNGSNWYSATTWRNTGASLSTNAWHHVEVYFAMNSISANIAQPDGIMQEWVDGTLVINHPNIIYRTNQDATKKWAQFVLGAYIGSPGAPIAETMWLDELNVYDSLPSADTTPPTVTAFTMPSTYTSLTVPITAYTIQDETALAAAPYCVTSTNSTTNCDWLASHNTSFTFSSAGTKTAYAWAKDAAGNISSSVPANVTITLGDTTAPAAPSGLSVS